MKYLLLLVVFLLPSVALADPGTVITRGDQDCQVQAKWYWRIATDLRSGTTLRSEIAWIQPQMTTPEARQFTQEAIEEIYNQPLVTPDTWFGFRLAYCEAEPPADPFIIMPAPVTQGE